LKKKEREGGGEGVMTSVTILARLYEGGQLVSIVVFNIEDGNPIRKWSRVLCGNETLKQVIVDRVTTWERNDEDVIDCLDDIQGAIGLEYELGV
jgi:hypothetical protein